MAQRDALAKATRAFVEADRAHAEAKARAERAAAAADRLAIRRASWRADRVPA